MPRTENTQLAIYRVILLCNGAFCCMCFFSLQKPVFIIQIAHQNISSIDLDALSMSDASSIASPDHRSDLGHGVLVNYLVFETLLNHTQRFAFFAFSVPPRCPSQAGEGSWSKVPFPGPMWIPMSGRNPLLLIAQLSLSLLCVILERTGRTSYLPPCLIISYIQFLLILIPIFR